MCFIAGCINIPNMVFFSSNYYAKDDDERTSALPFALRTSAVCTDTSWEPCPTCLEQDFGKFPANQDRLAFANVGGNALPFILKNNCEMSGLVGVVTIITILFVSASLFYFVYLQNKKAIEIDRSMQTSRDYSIEVEVSQYCCDGFDQKGLFRSLVHYYNLQCSPFQKNTPIRIRLLTQEILKCGRRSLKTNLKGCPAEAAAKNQAPCED